MREGMASEVDATSAASLYAGRADHYVAGRPSYPPEVVELLRTTLGIAPGADVADIGAGTGNFSVALIAGGYRVHAVEPDAAMREELDRRCAGSTSFRSCAGHAHATLLPDRSVDAVTAAQALHWFPVHQARDEFLRIAKGDAPLLCVWNERRRAGSPLLEALDRLLIEQVPAYRASLDGAPDPCVLTGAYSADGHVDTRWFHHEQMLAEDGLVARVLSSSYAPRPGDIAAAHLAASLREMARRHAVAGQVTIEYDVVVTLCRMRPA